MANRTKGRRAYVANQTQSRGDKLLGLACRVLLQPHSPHQCADCQSQCILKPYRQGMDGLVKENIQLVSVYIECIVQLLRPGCFKEDFELMNMLHPTKPNAQLYKKCSYAGMVSSLLTAIQRKYAEQCDKWRKDPSTDLNDTAAIPAFVNANHQFEMTNPAFSAVKFVYERCLERCYETNGEQESKVKKLLRPGPFTMVCQFVVKEWIMTDLYKVEPKICSMVVFWWTNIFVPARGAKSVLEWQEQHMVLCADGVTLHTPPTWKNNKYYNAKRADVFISRTNVLFLAFEYFCNTRPRDAKTNRLFLKALNSYKRDAKGRKVGFSRHPMGERGIGSQLKSTLKSAGVVDSDLYTVYGMRKSFITMCWATGCFSVEDIKEISGHTSQAVHCYIDEHEQALKKQSNLDLLQSKLLPPLVVVPVQSTLLPPAGFKLDLSNLNLPKLPELNNLNFRTDATSSMTQPLPDQHRPPQTVHVIQPLVQTVQNDSISQKISELDEKINEVRDFINEFEVSEKSGDLIMSEESNEVNEKSGDLIKSEESNEVSEKSGDLIMSEKSNDLSEKISGLNMSEESNEVIKESGDDVLEEDKEENKESVPQTPRRTYPIRAMPPSFGKRSKEKRQNRIIAQTANVTPATELKELKEMTRRWKPRRVMTPKEQFESINSSFNKQIALLTLRGRLLTKSGGDPQEIEEVERRLANTIKGKMNAIGRCPYRPPTSIEPNENDMEISDEEEDCFDELDEVIRKLDLEDPESEDDETMRTANAMEIEPGPTFQIEGTASQIAALMRQCGGVSGTVQIKLR